MAAISEIIILFNFETTRPTVMCNTSFSAYVGQWIHFAGQGLKFRLNGVQ